MQKYPDPSSDLMAAKANEAAEAEFRLTDREIYPLKEQDGYRLLQRTSETTNPESRRTSIAEADQQPRLDSVKEEVRSHGGSQRNQPKDEVSIEAMALSGSNTPE